MGLVSCRFLKAHNIRCSVHYSADCFECSSHVALRRLRNTLVPGARREWLEDAPVWQMRFALEDMRLLRQTFAYASVRHRHHRP
jgi:hypothetical protein